MLADNSLAKSTDIDVLYTGQLKLSDVCLSVMSDDNKAVFTRLFVIS